VTLTITITRRTAKELKEASAPQAAECKEVSEE